MAFSLRVSANLKQLAVIRHFVREKLSEFGVGAQITADVILAVDEAATNIVQHGYEGSDGSIEIEIYRDSDSLVIRLRDNAIQFDPTKLPTPDLNLPLERRPLGKMGVYLMNELMDEVRYHALGGGGNELTLVKRKLF